MEQFYYKCITDECAEQETLSSILAEFKCFIQYGLYVNFTNWAVWIVGIRTTIAKDRLLLLGTLVIFVEKYRKLLIEM